MKRISLLFVFFLGSSLVLLGQDSEVVDWESRVNNLHKAVVKLEKMDLEKQDPSLLEAVLDLLKSQVMFVHEGLREKTADLATKGKISWARATEEFQVSIGPAESLVTKIAGVLRRKNLR